MKVNEKSQKRGIEDRIEAPAPYPGATRPGEMQVQHTTRHREAEQKLHDLAVRHHPLPLGSDPNRTQEIVSVHEHVNRRVGHERHREQGLARAQPQVAHDQHGRVVVHVEEGQPLDGATQDDEEGVEEFEDF